jgi:hypothetical protein
MSEPDTERCIRCDEPVPVGPGTDLRAYHTLTFHHETGAFPLCNDCFDEVEDRDLWD